MMILSLAPLLTGPGPNSTQIQRTSSSGSGYFEITAIPTPTITPVIITSTPAPAPVSTPVQLQNRVVTYITLEPKPTAEIASHQSLTVPPQENYITIYSLTNQDIWGNFPYISYDLKNPPLIIDYDVTLMDITDEKYMEYKIMSNKYEVTQTNIRPSEAAFFSIIVRDKKTGDIVAEDGVGGVYGQQTPKKIMIPKPGDYQVDLSGRFVTVTLTMKVKKEGNIQ
jgi:hypothetical protein